MFISEARAGLPEDHNAWSAPNSDKICYACGQPYNRPPGIGCYLKRLHESSLQPESGLAEEVARQAQATRAARRDRRQNYPSSVAPEVSSNLLTTNRIAFLHGKIPQLERKLSYLERGGGSKWEIEHVRSALNDLKNELTRLEDQSPVLKSPGPRSGESLKPSQSQVQPETSAPPMKPITSYEPSPTPNGRRRRRLSLRFPRFRHRRWVRWRFIYVSVFLIIFAWFVWGDVTGPASPQDYKLGGFTLVLWGFSIPIPLVLYSLVSAFMLFIPIRVLGWGTKQIARHRIGKGITAIVLLLLVIGFAVSNSPLQSVLIPSPNQFYSSLSDMGSYASQLGNQANSGTTQPYSTEENVGQTSTSGSSVSVAPTQSTGFTVSNPEFVNGQANISFPAEYSTLANYALGLINQDRESNGAAPLSLGTISSGQQHADSMLYFNYFEHTDNQGYTPQQRFEMLGGGNSLMGENQGLDYCTYSPPSATAIYPTSCSLQTIENAIANSEWQMMNNDVTCCSNGHRMNILDSSYTQVSIGIAFSSGSDATVYFVEDFYGPCPTGYICG
jgi:uncharacterized protein YkwD